MITITDTSPHASMRAAITRLDAAIAAATCRICGKFETHQHTSATRAAHSAHLTRYGWSGMCPSPQAR